MMATNGVKQDGALLPTLFAVYVDSGKAGLNGGNQ